MNNIQEKYENAKEYHNKIIQQHKELSIEIERNIGRLQVLEMLIEEGQAHQDDGIEE